MHSLAGVAQQVASPASVASGTLPTPAKAPEMEKQGAALQIERGSVYMYGPVGTGKTMLLDLFHTYARGAGLRVLRQHFYEFMLRVHEDIHEIEEEQPVEIAANTLADGVEVLCFDEFQITDIQDAVILPRLFEVFFRRGLAIVMTSNTAPGMLYSGGLNRHVHLPAFVALLSDYCVALGLRGGAAGSGSVDYRRRAEAAEIAAAKTNGVGSLDGVRVDDGGFSDSYLWGADAGLRLEEWWRREMLGVASSGQTVFAQEQRDLQLPLPMGRTLRVPRAAGLACFASFPELCAADRGEADFLAIADRFGVVLLRDVPKFASLEAIDEVRRFVKLLDVLYDRRVRLMVAAAAPIDTLFEGIREEVQKDDIRALEWRTALYSADGKAGMAPSAVGTLCEAIRATDRAESRLREMRTKRYWEECSHGRAALR